MRPSQNRKKPLVVHSAEWGQKLRTYREELNLTQDQFCGQFYAFLNKAHSKELAPKFLYLTLKGQKG